MQNVALGAVSRPLALGAGPPIHRARRGSPDPSRSARVSRSIALGAGLPTPPNAQVRLPSRRFFSQ